MTTFLNNNMLYWGIVAAFCLAIHLMHKKYSTTASFRTAYLTSFLVLPGTYMHELAHAVVGFLTHAQPVKVSVVPRLETDTDGQLNGSLGLTWFTNPQWYNMALVGVAPLLLVPLGVLACTLTTWDNPILKVAEAYLVANMFMSSKPSSVDLEFAKKYWWGPFVVVGAVIAAIYGGAMLSPALLSYAP